MNLETIIVTVFKNTVWSKSAKASYSSRKRNSIIALKNFVKKGR